MKLRKGNERKHIIAHEKTTQPKTEPHTHTKLKLEHIEQKLGGKKKRKRHIQKNDREKHFKTLDP